MNNRFCMKAFVAAAAVLAGGLAQADELDLSGTWRLTQAETNSVSCPVAVPGGIYTALYDAKYIPNPYFAQNERLTQWPGRVEWDFSRTFDVPADFAARKSVTLRLEDVDCFADVYVNGRKVGSTCNRFQRFDFDVKPYLKAGANEIRARFHSTELVSYAETNKYSREFDISNATVKKINLVRTVQCHGGWDWGITQMDTGLMGTVKLIAVDTARLDYVYTVQKFADDFSSVDVEVTAEAFAPESGEADFAVRLGDSKATVRASLSEGFNKVSATVRVERPRLWWPNECGEQPLYDFSASLGESSVSRRIGLRKLEVVNDMDAEPDPVDGKKGRQMTVAVNGRRIFCKGADWIPCDAFENRQRGWYRQHLGDAKLSHMNMVRVWGGGQFEHPEFYRLCDELGILIWHDFMFSCATYPGTPEFLDGVKKEVTHQLKNLRDHASIALWCGDNECIGAAGWFARGDDDGPNGMSRAANVRLCAERAKFLADVCRECDPTRTFWPSSPCLGPGNFGDGWKDDSSGDMHFWEVWFGGALFSRYYKIRPRFCSEFGFQSYPSVETALTYVAPDQLNPTAPDFFYHQKSPNGNKYILETMMVYFRFPNGVKSVHYLSQVQQAMAIRAGVEHFRHIMPRCMGSIYWQLCDNWPVASWSSIEYGGKWKHLQYHARRFYSPCAVMVAPAYKDDGTLEVWAVNDKDEPLVGSAKLEAWTFGGAVADAKTLAMDVPARSARRLGSFPLSAFGTDAERKGRFLALSADECPDNEWQFQLYRESNLARASVKAALAEANGVWTVTLSTDRPAFFVWADAPGIRGVFSDNSFLLLPGRPKTLTFTKRPDEKASFADFRRAFELMHLRESYE
ncbi:MAG: glycoside hydrolase family 2 protein [Kiritimatiellae bacterium]|nr:glycoside hydrolase family 2 protein [Kiritimatiellia bacterium]